MAIPQHKETLLITHKYLFMLKMKPWLFTEWSERLADLQSIQSDGNDLKLTFGAHHKPTSTFSRVITCPDLENLPSLQDTLKDASTAALQADHITSLHLLDEIIPNQY